MLRACLLSIGVVSSACGGPTDVPPSRVQVLAPALLASICDAAPCGGPSATVDVFRDPRGAVAHLARNHGECADSPSLLFAPDGTLRDTIPLEPVVPGSPEAEAFRARVERWTAGLTHTDTILCRDGTRLEPR